MSVESVSDFSPLPDETAMAQLAYSRWERAEAESMAEYVSRRRTVDLAALVRQVTEEELSDAEKQVVRMRYYENRTPIEIANLLHLHKSTVSRTLANAEAHIRQCLKYVVRYQYNLRHVPFLPLAVREAMAVSAARYGTGDAASYLRRLRQGENLSPDAVAAAVGIPNRRLRDIEDGQAVPDARELLRLASFYGVCADSILKGEKTCRPH
jgi:DNA-binding CsgD family transcriptional regulator